MIEDIEDYNAEVEIQRFAQDKIYPKRIKKKNNTSLDNEKTSSNTFLPGKANIYVKTWGCSHNNSDSEYMAGQLVNEGYTITNNKANADVWLLNSCTVKNPSQDTFVNAIYEGNNKNVPVIVAGCVPQGQKKLKAIENLSIIGVQQIDRVVEVVEQTLQGNTVQLLSQSKNKANPQLNLPKVRKNALIEIIPINSGCLNQCTYCKTKHARGDLKSYPIDEILLRIATVINQGEVKEIWLTSEDTGTYGRDIGTSLPELLSAITNILPFGIMLRLGMTNPPYILEHLSAMATILNHSNVYSFLHIPVQAGSNRILDI